MAFFTGNTGGSPALAVVTQIETMLSAAGYELVDTFIPTGTETYRVWRNPAANNQSGVDWFVSFGRASDTATTVTVMLGEAYLASDHTMRKSTQTSNTTARTVDTDQTAIASTAVNVAGLGMRSTLGVPANTAYLLSVNRQRIIIGVNFAASTTTSGVLVNPSPCLYLGCFDSLVPASVSRDTALGQLSIFFSSSNHYLAGSTTREPGLVAGTSSSAEFAWQTNNISGQRFTVGRNTEGYTNRALGGRPLLFGRNLPNASDFIRGMPRDILNTPITNVTPSFGDQIEVTVDGSTNLWSLVFNQAGVLAYYVNEAV